MDVKQVLNLYPYIKSRSNDNIDVINHIVDIDAALNKISKRHRFILKKIHFEGYTQTEVSEMLGVTKSTLNGVYNTALESFRKAYKGE